MAQDQSLTEENSKQVVAANKTCAIQIPNHWSLLADPTGRAAITVGDQGRKAFISVSTVAKEDFDGSLSDFLDQAIKELQPHIANFLASTPVDCAVGGMPGERVRITGTQGRFKLVYTLTVTETESQFYRILTFTIPSAEEEANETFAKVLATFKPLDAGS
jgi:hypothetical protein